MQLEDFNNIDLNNVGNLPAAVKSVLLLILAAIIMVMGYMMIINPNVKKLSDATAKESELKDAFLLKKSQAIKIEAYKQQMIDIQRTFGALLKQLPDKSQMDGLLTDINQAGLGRGLEFDSFIPKPEEVKEFYAEKPIYIKVIGSYHDLGAFTTDVAKLPRIVTLNDIKVEQNGKDGKLVLETTAKTFRYLDINEIAAQKAKKDEEKAKKK